MPSLANYASARPIKALYLGDPASGKTGSLTSLVAAGFKLRIYDLDNLLEPLFQFVMRECPDKAQNIVFQTLTDSIKAQEQLTTMIGGGLRVMPATDGTPTAFRNLMKQLDHWKTKDEDLGKPADWETDTIVVIDTLSALSRAAFRFVQSMNPMCKDERQYYGAAQELIRNVLALLFSEKFHPNVMVLAHINYDKNHLDVMKGFPKHIGNAMQTEIGSYFNCIFLAESIDGKRRQIRTNSTGIVDLKNPVSFRVPETLPLETGLATIFKAVRNEGNSK